MCRVKYFLSNFQLCFHHYQRFTEPLNQFGFDLAVVRWRKLQQSVGILYTGCSMSLSYHEGMNKTLSEGETERHLHFIASAGLERKGKYEFFVHRPPDWNSVNEEFARLVTNNGIN